MSGDPQSTRERKHSVFKKVKNAFKFRRGGRRRSPSRPRNVSFFFSSQSPELLFQLIPSLIICQSLAYIQTHDYGTPPRKQFPSEIQVVPGTPNSIISAVSGVTGMPEPGFSMFSSVLPSLKSDDSMQSESLFGPLSPKGKEVSFKREPLHLTKCKLWKLSFQINLLFAFTLLALQQQNQI